METQNKIPQPQPQVAPVVEQSTEIPIPQKPLVPQKPIDKIKEKFDKLPKTTKTMVTAVLIMFAIIIILILLSAIFGKEKTTVEFTPSPSPISVSPTPDVILNASRYATDSGVLKIESDLKDFQNQLNVSDVKQGALTPPNLDWDINFNN